MELFLVIIAIAVFSMFQSGSKAAKKAQNTRAQFTQGIPPEKPTQAEAMENWRKQHSAPQAAAPVTPGKIASIRPAKPAPQQAEPPAVAPAEAMQPPVEASPISAVHADAYKAPARNTGSAFTPAQLRTAIITREILDKPIALRQKRRI